jgi:hypothetical protein
VRLISLAKAGKTANYRRQGKQGSAAVYNRPNFSKGLETTAKMPQALGASSEMWKLRLISWSAK